MEIIYIDKETNQVLLGFEGNTTIPKEGETVNIDIDSEDSEAKLFKVHQVVHNIIVGSKEIIHRVRIYLEK